LTHHIERILRARVHDAASLSRRLRNEVHIKRENLQPVPMTGWPVWAMVATRLTRAAANCVGAKLRV